MALQGSLNGSEKNAAQQIQGASITEHRLEFQPSIPHLGAVEEEVVSVFNPQPTPCQGLFVKSPC